MAQVKLTGVYRSAFSALQLLGTSHSVYDKCRNPSFLNNFSNKKKYIIYIRIGTRLVDATRFKPEGRGFTEIFQRHNPSDRFMALGSNQPQTEISK